MPVRDLRVGPNPVRSSTRISYTLPAAGPVECAVYDGTGRKVVELSRGWQPAGQQSLSWDAAGAQPGIYLVRLSGAATGTARLVRAD